MRWVSPVITVRDVTASLRFYTEVLEFDEWFRWGGSDENPETVGVMHGHARVICDKAGAAGLPPQAGAGAILPGERPRLGVSRMGEWSIRRELVIEAPADVVWTYVGTAARVSEWWCPPPTVQVEFEPWEGGRFEEHYHGGEYAYDVEGTVVAYVPRRRLAIRRVTEGSPSPADLIDITLSEAGDCTRVVIDHSFEDLPESRRKDMEEFFAEGWSSALQRLRELATAVDS